MKNIGRASIILASISFISICGCSANDWTNRLTWKNDTKNNIFFDLDLEGETVTGPCLTRKTLDSYGFYFSPIKREYSNDEINMKHYIGIINEVPIKSIIGTISFNEDYLEATVNIKILDSNKQFTDFAGNGIYKLKDYTRTESKKSN